MCCTDASKHADASAPPAAETTALCRGGDGRSGGGGSIGGERHRRPRLPRSDAAAASGGGAGARGGRVDGKPPGAHPWLPLPRRCKRRLEVTAPPGEGCWPRRSKWRPGAFLR